MGYFANCEDPDEMQHNAADEMQHNAAFHLGLQCFVRVKDLLNKKYNF